MAVLHEALLQHLRCIHTQRSGCNSGNGSGARAVVACSSAGCHGKAPRQCPFQLVCFPAFLTAHMLALLDQPTPPPFVKLSTHTLSATCICVTVLSLCSLCVLVPQHKHTLSEHA